MERKTDLNRLAELFGANFIGPDILKHHSLSMGIECPSKIPPLSYDLEFLIPKKDEYLLFLSSSKMSDGRPITLLSLRNYFGLNSSDSKPGFYNQDWYLNEPFAQKELDCRWNLVRKEIIEESRAQDPDKLLLTPINFPSAVLCAFTFFLYWSVRKQYLWKYDYVWCSDLDHNNDRIYVGCYSDKQAIKNDGFEIHRHLALKPSYGSVNYF
jgi:hypothetical protein